MIAAFLMGYLFCADNNLAKESEIAELRTQVWLSNSVVLLSLVMHMCED